MAIDGPSELNLRQRKSAQTRADLLAAARAAFATAGYQQTALEDIARAVGATRGAFYRHFADKRDIFDHVAQQLASELVAQVWDISYELANDSSERERHAARLFLEQLCVPEVNRILAVDAPAVLGYHRWSEVIYTTISGPLAAGVAGWSSAGAFPKRLVEPITHLLVGGFQTASAHLSSVDDPVALAGDYEDALVYMIGAVRQFGIGAAAS